MSNATIVAGSRVSTVEFLALGAAFTNHIVKSSVKKTSKSIARKLSSKSAPTA